MAQKKAATLDLRTYLAKARGGTSKEYQKNRTVFSQGNPADAVFYIEKGKVKLTVLSARGKEAVVAILGNGDFFGEGCLAGQPLRIATAASITECSILRVQKETMIRMLHNEPAWSERFMAYLLSRNVRIEEDLVDQLFNSSEKRLARILLLLTRFGKDGQHLLTSWGPGRFDAVLDKDGKAFRPDGKQAGTLIPPAFGLASVNLSTWTGFGSVTYWNAYVAATQMHGPGTFFDAVQRPRAVSRIRQEPLRRHAGNARPGDLEAGCSSLLPARPPRAEAAGGEL